MDKATAAVEAALPIPSSASDIFMCPNTAQISMHAIAHEVCAHAVGESALKVDSGRKIPFRTGASNLPQRCAVSTLCQLSYIPAPSEG